MAQKEVSNKNPAFTIERILLFVSKCTTDVMI